MRRALDAHTTLSILAACVSVLEGGGVYDPASHRAVQRIIDLCQAEQQRLLRRLDMAEYELEAKGVRR